MKKFRTPKIEEFIPGFAYHMRAFDKQDWSETFYNIYPKTPFGIGSEHPELYIQQALTKDRIRVEDK